jgi:hypothetical protein
MSFLDADLLTALAPGLVPLVPPTDPKALDEEDSTTAATGPDCEKRMGRLGRWPAAAAASSSSNEMPRSTRDEPFRIIDFFGPIDTEAAEENA